MVNVWGFPETNRALFGLVMALIVHSLNISLNDPCFVGYWGTNRSPIPQETDRHKDEAVKERQVEPGGFDQREGR